MASISRYGVNRECRRITFTRADGARPTIYLGKISDKGAQSILFRVEALVAAQFGKYPLDPATAQWVADASDDLAEKLAKVGLIAERGSAMLGGFLDSYIASRHDVKPNTRLHLEQVRDTLVAHFGADKPLRAITPGDADGYRLALLKKGLAENTIRRRCGRAKQFFRAAQRRNLIVTNPFADLKTAIQSNDSRFYFVTRTEAQKVIDACPNAEWRLLVALARYGGLRCPSEHLALRWEDINWEHDRMTVRSPKTEHHHGGESRIIPIFPELRPYLEDARELAEPGAVHVIARYRRTNANLRTQFFRIVRRAGLTPWEKPFQNMRSTRETELCEEFPAHVVCRWLGNSQPVAQKHYLQVTDEHFARATQPSAERARITALPVAAGGRKSSPDKNGHLEPLCATQAAAKTCGDLLQFAVTGKGRQTTPLGDELVSPTSCHAETSADTLAPRCANHNARADEAPGLAIVAAAWPHLGEAARKAILTIVRRALDGAKSR